LTKLDRRVALSLGGRTADSPVTTGEEALMASDLDRFHETLMALNSVLLTQTRLDDVLTLVASLGRDTLEGVTSVSVSVQRDNRLVTPASSDDAALRIDSVQYGSGQGPCVEAATKGVRVDLPTTDGHPRWPELQEEASKLGIHSITSLPLSVGDTPIGALNLYSDRPGGLPVPEVDRALKFAKAAAVLLANAQALEREETRAAQLKEALLTRDLIGQAKGILMEREGVSADAAFDLLRKASQAANVKLRDIAERFVAVAQQSPKRRR
jgi:GAF domain-containing protein